jgi:hypothetical protein
MTAQVHEGLIIEGKETSMAFCPPIPQDHPQIIQLTTEEVEEGIRKEEISPWVFSTACWRRYVATWELKGGRFYLVHIDGQFKLKSDEPVFADWVTAVLRIPDGELLHYVHMGFGSVFEFENHIKIENGLVVDERKIDNRNKDVDSGELGWKNMPGNENQFDGDNL